MSTRELIIVGLSHRTAPIAIREALAIAPEQLENVLSELVNLNSTTDSVLLSTCNRTEIYMGSESPAVTEQVASQWFQQRLPEPHDGHELYIYRGPDAVRHLFRVASSLDSMVVGENQILAQVRQSWEVASSHHAISTVLRRFFSHALATGKRVRHETSISEGNVSVASLACDLALKIFGDFEGRSALLLGAGEVGEQVAESLSAFGARIEICNRSLERAQSLATRYHAHVVNADALEEALERIDVLIASTSSQEHILNEERIRHCVKARHGRPLFIVDIGVPRNIAPEVGNIDNVFVYDIDDLQTLTEANLAARKKEAKKAEIIVGQEVEAFETWRRSLELTPAIVALQNRVHGIASEELERALTRMPHLTDRDRSSLQDLVRRIVNRLLHAPLTHLKQARANDADELVSSINHLFDLERSTQEKVQQAVKSQSEPAGALLSQNESSK